MNASRLIHNLCVAYRVVAMYTVRLSTYATHQRPYRHRHHHHTVLYNQTKSLTHHASSTTRASYSVAAYGRVLCILYVFLRMQHINVHIVSHHHEFSVRTRIRMSATDILSPRPNFCSLPECFCFIEQHRLVSPQLVASRAGGSGYN